MNLTWQHYQDWLGPQWCQTTNPKITCPLPAQLITDSRQIGKDQFFVPIVGEIFDGHKFISQVMVAGANGFFYEESKRDLIPAKYLDSGIAVKDCLASLQAIASGWLQYLNPENVVAIVGSVGKTTVKEMCATIFAEAHCSHVTHGSFNNEIGVPLTLLKLKPEHKSLVLEFGARHRGDIKFLCQMAPPSIAVLLNVYRVHLGEFGDFETLTQTKTEVFRHSQADATLITHADNSTLLDAAKATKKNVQTFGLTTAANVHPVRSEYLPDGGMSISLKTSAGTFDVGLAVGHECYGINAAAATSIALAAGIDQKTIALGLKEFSPAPGRFQIHQLPERTIIDDSYNASPASMAAGFKSCRQQFKGKEIAVVLGDMLELGDESVLEHEKIGALCWSTLGPQQMITVGTLAKHIGKGANAAGMSDQHLRHYANVDQLIESGLPLLADFEVVFLKASHSLGLEKLTEKLKAL